MGIACRKGQAVDRHTDRNIEFEPFDLHTLAQDREDAVGAGLQPLAFLARRPEIGRAGVERTALHLDADFEIVRDDRRDVQIYADVEARFADRARDTASAGSGVAFVIAGIGAYPLA